MKTKMVICMLLISVLITSKVKSQQPKYERPATFASQQMMKVITVGDYSYSILPASNNSFGYDIFQDKRLIFHVPVLAYPGSDGSMHFPGREQAQKIVLTAIGKLKKGKLPVFTHEELKRIVQ